MHQSAVLHQCERLNQRQFCYIVPIKASKKEKKKNQHMKAILFLIGAISILVKQHPAISISIIDSGKRVEAGLFLYGEHINNLE